MEKKNVPVELDDDALETVSGGLETKYPGEMLYNSHLAETPSGSAIVYERSEDSLKVQSLPPTETNEKTAMDKLLEIQNSQ